MDSENRDDREDRDGSEDREGSRDGEDRRHGGADDAPPVHLAPEDLAPDTLRAVIESFVLREGTDYGLHETSLDDKVAQVLGQLQRREAYVVFDPSSASVGIVVASAVPEAERTGRCRDSTSPGTKRF